MSACSLSLDPYLQTAIFTPMMYKKRLTRDQALQKLRQYCGYQERCHQEVRGKLYKLGVGKLDHDHIIATLIEENYLDEERFAIAFAGGKFRIKEWGKNKIKYELRQRDISDYCIRKALDQIGQEEYIAVLKKLATQKLETAKADEPLIRKKKTLDYLTGRGFEMELVRMEINNL